MDEKTFLLALFVGLVLLDGGLGNWASRKYGARLPCFYTKTGARYAANALTKGSWVMYPLTILILALSVNGGLALWNDTYSIWLVALGFAFMLAATWVNYLGRRDLAKNFTPTTATSRGQKLVTTGVLSAVRHPIYLGFVLLDAGMALVAANALGAALFALSVAGLVIRARNEERELAAKFGKKYSGYARRVPGFIPRP